MQTRGFNTYHGHRGSLCGILLLGMLLGLCEVVAGERETVYRATGSFLNLSLNHSKQSVSWVDWEYNQKTFYKYSSPNYSVVERKFSGRVKENQIQIGVTVQDLKPSDSGLFTIVAEAKGPAKQLPTQEFEVFVQDSITSVKIEKNQTWLVFTNSCMISVSCEALGAESVSYRWSGYKDDDGAQLNFSLSPAEEEVTLNCTAANKVSTSSATERLTCTQLIHTEPDRRIETWIAAAAGGGAAALTLLIIALCCWRKFRKNRSDADVPNTLYADVNDIKATKHSGSDSVANGMTVYEMVDDFKVAPDTSQSDRVVNEMTVYDRVNDVREDKTIYAKVTFPQKKTDMTTSSSPYQLAV